MDLGGDINKFTYAPQDDYPFDWDLNVNAWIDEGFNVPCGDPNVI